MKTAKRSLQERILLKLAMPQGAKEPGATASYTMDNCLNYARRTLRDFDKLVSGKTVLDYGCGPGWQAVAMHVRCKAERVVGVDISDKWLNHGATLAERHNCSQRVQFAKSVPSEMTGQFDVVISLGAFEHYADPVGELQRMRSQLRKGGRILLSWAEPWYSNSGSHIGNFTRIPGTNKPIPWVNLFFSDAALLTLRAQFRPDHPARLQDIEGGLNKMTLKKFEDIIFSSGLKVEDLRYFATLGIPLVTRVPVVREVLTSAVSCVLLER